MDRSTELEGLLAAEQTARANLQSQLDAANAEIAALKGQLNASQGSDTIDSTAVAAMAAEEAIVEAPAQSGDTAAGN